MGAMQQSLLATGGSAPPVTLDTPQFQSTTGLTADITGITVPAPLSYINGDLLVLVITSTNQTITTPTAGGTWTQVTNSPQSTGTAGASQSTRIAVFTKIASGAQANVTVTDTGVMTTGSMFVFRKVDNTTPVEVTAGSVLATAGTTHTLPAVTTSTNNAMIAHCSGIGRDSATSVNYSSPTNANLTGLTVRQSTTTSLANGGGIGLVTGVKATAGATGTTSVTVAGAAKGAFVTLGIKPSTNYDSAVRVTGPTEYGLASVSIQDQQFGSFITATAGILINSDGTISTYGNFSDARTTWLNNTTTGSDYYVRATTISGGGFGTVGTWQQCNTQRIWYIEATNDGTSTATASWVIKLEFATDSGGTNIVATNTVDLYALSEIII